MIMQIIGIPMHGDKHFIFVAPHTPRRFHPDGKGLFFIDFFFPETHIPVIRDVAARFSITALRRHHGIINGLLRAVDRVDVNGFIGLLPVGGIMQRLQQIPIQSVWTCCFLRVIRIGEYFQQMVLYGPEAGGCRVASHSIPSLLSSATKGSPFRGCSFSPQNL